MAETKRVTFGSKLGVVLATVGCAVGLGSIWRFPYMVGDNGGFAFLLIFIVCTIFLGLPIMITEFFIGQLRFSIDTAFAVPLAASLLTVFKNISLFRFPPGIGHLLTP